MSTSAVEVPSGRIDAHGLEQVPGRGGGNLAASQLNDRRALRDGAVERACCRRARHEGKDAGAARRFADDGDVAGIAAEGRDVGLHPRQRRHLVEQAEVAGAGEALAVQIGQVEVAEGAEAVVDRDEHAAVAAKASPWYQGTAPVPLVNAPPWMNTSTGQRAVPSVVRRPDVQRQAVLAHRPVGQPERRLQQAGSLRRLRPELEGVAHRGPRRRRLRGGVAIRRGIRNALEHARAIVAPRPPHRAGGGDDDAHPH